jgi:hypothetical protein
MSTNNIPSVILATMFLSAPSVVDYQVDTRDSTYLGVPYSPVPSDYLGAVGDAASTVLRVLTNAYEVNSGGLRSVLAYAGLPEEEFRKAAALSSEYFSERGLSVRGPISLDARQDPEEGFRYLKMEIPAVVGSLEELVDIDFELSMKVANALNSGAEKLIVSVVRA